MRTSVSAKLVPVYRKHQSTMTSPCTAGDRCSTCLHHAACHTGNACRSCRRGKGYQCERAEPANPAFVLRIKDAISLVKDGLASFINRNTAVQLNYSKLAHLRDQSCKVDERLILEYLGGSRRARAAIELGWASKPATVTGSRPDRPQYPFV